MRRIVGRNCSKPTGWCGIRTTGDPWPPTPWQAFHVDLHLEVGPAALTVRRAQAIAHQVKDAIRARWPQIADVLVHVEPHGDGRRERWARYAP